MHKLTKQQILILLIFSFVTILFKVLPSLLDIGSGSSFYPWNFSPLFPVGLFCGAMVVSRRMAITVPLLSMFFADVLLAIVKNDQGMLFYSSAPFVYLALALTVLVGMSIPKHRPVWAIACAGSASAILFFVLSNFGAWVMPFNGAYTYDLTLGGLATCYIAAIPFYKNTLFAFAVYLPLLFHPVMMAAWKRDAEPEGELVPQPVRKT